MLAMRKGVIKGDGDSRKTARGCVARIGMPAIFCAGTLAAGGDENTQRVCESAVRGRGAGRGIMAMLWMSGSSRAPPPPPPPTVHPWAQQRPSCSANNVEGARAVQEGVLTCRALCTECWWYGSQDVTPENKAPLVALSS